MTGSQQPGFGWELKEIALKRNGSDLSWVRSRHFSASSAKALTTISKISAISLKQNGSDLSWVCCSRHFSTSSFSWFPIPPSQV
jgi:hypothetical protein